MWISLVSSVRSIPPPNESYWVLAPVVQTERFSVVRPAQKIENPINYQIEYYTVDHQIKYYTINYLTVQSRWNH